MFKLSIILNLIGFISSAYLQAESNYRKPKLERNNILNKGLWVRNQEKRPMAGDFIFRANSLDVDTLVQGNNEVFRESGPFISSYIERSKRSAYSKKKQRLRESIKKCADDKECNKESVFIESNLIKKLKPSFFNDYPYEVAIVMNKPQNNDTEAKETIRKNKDILDNKSLKTKKEEVTISESNITNITKPLSTKRSMSDVYELHDVKKIEFTETLNKTDDNEIKIDRSVFDKGKDIIWHQTAPVNVYKVLPKDKEIKNKPISERGLIKVLSMLTKTFKKIMKQHSDIKNIHKQLHILNEEFEKNIDSFNKKFTDFDSKYAEILKVNTEVKKMEEKLKSKEQYFNEKEREFSKKLLDFENQQRKFLAQQKQFYSVQKLMLEENEKINLKQNIIAKTQSEISQRQNNFARILKKSQQMYSNIKAPQGTTLNLSITKSKNKEQNNNSVSTTTVTPRSTESVKINLLSMLEPTPIQNYDKQILSDKDHQNVDDLIYKYYFNNTFIDDIMRNNILASFPSEKRSAINKKNKRNEETMKGTTILLPVDNIGARDFIDRKVQRERRWIKHSRKNNKHKNKNPTSTLPTTVRSYLDSTTKNVKPDPFIVMATNFCNEIGQNGSAQILSWCIEKALRRLQIMNMKFGNQQNPSSEANENKKSKDDLKNNSVFKATNLGLADLKTSITLSPAKLTSDMPSTVVTKTPDIIMYFPDNEELESNLKQYELIRDTEGAVYFDGSLHSSDIAKIEKHDRIDSEGFSDIMPGLDSNSRVEMDPMAFDIQAQRRANVRRINENIMKMKMV